MRHPVIHWLLSVIVTVLVTRARISGRDRLPPTGVPVVLVANHRSWIDPLLIVRALGPRRPVMFLAAREHIEKRALLDRVTGWLGSVVKLERGARDQRTVLRAASDALAGGATLALFPEGRINVVETTGVPLLELEPGAAVIARRGAATLVPVAIAGTGALHLGRRVVVAIGEPLAPGARGEDDAMTSRLRATLLALLPPEPPPARWRPGRWLGRLA